MTGASGTEKGRARKHSKYPPLDLDAMKRAGEIAARLEVPLHKAHLIAAATVGHLNCGCVITDASDRTAP